MVWPTSLSVSHRQLHIGPPFMASSEKDVWVFRIVHQNTGKPAQGVPVTVLDKTGNPAGYWVSESDGTVTIPRRDVAKLRLRVGLRNEEPIELVTEIGRASCRERV